MAPEEDREERAPRALVFETGEAGEGEGEEAAETGIAGTGEDWEGELEEIGGP